MFVECLPAVIAGCIRIRYHIWGVDTSVVEIKRCLLQILVVVTSCHCDLIEYLSSSSVEESRRHAYVKAPLHVLLGAIPPFVSLLVDY